MKSTRRLVAFSLATAAVAISTVELSPAASASTHQPSWCGWKPANNSHIWPAWVIQGPLNVRKGQSTSCDPWGQISAGSLTSPNLILRCQVKNGAGEVWYYADTNLNTDGSGRGWVFSGDVAWTFGTPMGC